MGLSIRAYARHRKASGLPGGTDAAVRKAIKTGRIAVLPDGKIDQKAADAAWSENTNSAKQTDAGAGQSRGECDPRPPRAVHQSEIDAVYAALDDEALGDDIETPDPDGPVTMVQATLANAVLSAKLKAERLKKERGEVVDRARAVDMVFDLARRERDGWLAWPARVAANMAAELSVNPHDLEQVLGRHLREELAARAEVNFEL